MSKMIKLTLLRILFCCCVLSVTGCASINIEPWVKPYERQNLADPIMSNNRHPIANMHIAHVYEARESSRGAEGTGGGGCGCN
jgi:hypothetical protein